MIRAGLVLGIALAAGGIADTASAQNFNGTCTNVYYRGSRLIATCLTAYGSYRTTSIDASACPPANINNANGQLVCAAGGGGYGGGGYGYGRRRYGY